MALVKIYFALALENLSKIAVPLKYFSEWLRKIQFFAFLKGKLDSDYRTLYLIVTSLFSVGLTIFLIWLIYIGQPDSTVNEGFIQFLYHEENGKPTGFLTNDSIKFYLAFIIGILPTFALWSFRNYNRINELETARLNHENSRKDTNLKDFQQLQKWATDTDENEALRISAIRQLGAFFQGQFGEQFQIPAYELLNALWVNQLTNLHYNISDFFEGKVLEYSISPSENPKYSEWEQLDPSLAINYRRRIRNCTASSFADSIVTAVFGDGGLTLKELEDKRIAQSLNSIGLLQKRNWSGIVPKVTLNFSGLNLTEIILAGADLKDVNLSDSILIRADLSGADFNYFDANFPTVSGPLNQDDLIVNGNTRVANLENADLRGADLTFASISLQSLSKCNIEGAYLINLRLNGTRDTCIENKGSSKAIICDFVFPKEEYLRILKSQTNEKRRCFSLMELSSSDETPLIVEIDYYIKRTRNTKFSTIDFK